jgi:copper chaperone CopZ
VRSALSKVNGVMSVSTTMTSAKLKVDKNRVNNDELIAAVRAVGDGYDAHVFE